MMDAMASDRAGRIPAALLLLAALLLFLSALLYNELILGLVDPSPPLDAETVTLIRVTQAWFAGAGALLLALSLIHSRFRRAGIAMDRRFPMHALMVVLSTGVPLFVLELSLRPFRTLEHEATSIFMRDEALGWRMRPGVEDVWLGVPVTINAKGLRGPEVDYVKPAGVTRILYLGDSVTFGFKLRGHDEAFPYQVETLLEARGHRIQSINAGVDGYSPWQEYAYLEAEGLKYDPDLVVVAFVLNDVTERLLLARSGGWGEGFQLVHTASNRFMRLLGESSIVAFGRQIAARIRFGADVREGARRQEELEAITVAKYPDRPDIMEAWRGTLADLEKLFALCRQRGIPAALVVFPYTFQFHDPATLDAPQRTLAAFADDQGVPMLDLLPRLLSIRKEGDPSLQELFFDGNHPNAEGHRVVASIIAAWLETAGLS